MSQKNNRLRGKAHQRKVAEKVNGLNIGTLGGADVITDKFSIECKSRAVFVARGWMTQSEKNCPNGKIPIVIVHEKNKRYDNDLVIIKLSHFLKLIEVDNEQSV